MRLMYHRDYCIGETMPATARATILRLFQQGAPRDPGDPISFATILEALSPEYSKGTVSARLSELVDEGILLRDARGTYRLAYTEEPIPDALAGLADLLADRFPQGKRQGAVLWDATAVLADSEDGVMAPVHVLETESFTGGSTARMLLDNWPGDETPYVEEFSDRITLLEAALGSAPVNASPSQRRFLIGPAEGNYASTQLHPQGIRLATPERILADLLGQDDPALGDIARVRLTSPHASIDPDRLFAAAGERDLLPDLFALLGQLQGRLPEALEEAYSRRLHGATRSAMEDPRA